MTLCTDCAHSSRPLSGCHRCEYTTDKVNAARAEGFADGIEAAALEAGLDNRKAMRRTPSEVAAAIRALRPDSSLVVLPREAVGEP